MGHTRLEMFLNSATNDFRKLPPSRRSLEQHVRKSLYQAGWVSCAAPPPKPEFGRKLHPTKDELMIDWTGSVPTGSNSHMQMSSYRTKMFKLQM